MKTHLRQKKNSAQIEKNSNSQPQNSDFRQHPLRNTPLLSDGAEKKNFPNTLMVPPNSLGQMLKFGTSNKKK